MIGYSLIKVNLINSTIISGVIITLEKEKGMH